MRIMTAAEYYRRYYRRVPPFFFFVVRGGITTAEYHQHLLQTQIIATAEFQWLDYSCGIAMGGRTAGGITTVELHRQLRVSFFVCDSTHGPCDTGKHLR